MKQLNAFPLLLLILSICGTPAIGRAQSLFQTVKPDVLVLVKKHPSGADIVEVSITAPGFPPELLQERMTQLCADIGYGPLGLQVYQSQIGATGNTMQFLKARFGTNGLIDSATGILRVQAIARAFAGIPSPNAIQGLAITFDAIKPTQQTLQRFKSRAVALEAQYNGPPAAGLEYRVQLLTQDPSAISIPDKAEPIRSKTASDTKTEVRAAPAWITWMLLVVTALAFGALVYFGFLRFNAKRR